MKKEDFKYHSTFATKRIRIVYPTEKSMAMAVASLKDLKDVLPANLDIEGNPDLIFNSFNAVVINRVNLNDDGIGTKDALSIASKFHHKFLDLEHNRKFVVGTIISHGYSEFLTNRTILEEEVKSLTAPFNLTLGGVVWAVINPDFAEQLIDSSDETSPLFEAISASWEIGFNECQIALGSRDLASAEIITDPQQIEEFIPFLKASGGTGQTKDGVPVYRIMTGDALPLGIGYTTTPAANVKGVIVAKEKEEPIKLTENEITDKLNNVDESLKESSKALVEQIELMASTQKNEQEKQENKKNSSQRETLDVNNNSIMKFTKLDDINEELFKDESVASSAKNFIGKYINDKIDEKSSEFAEQLEAKDKEAKVKEQEAKDLQQKLDETLAEVTKAQEELKKEQDVRASEKAEADFQSRMSDLDSKFNLNDKDKAAIAKSIKSLDETEFTEWFENFELFAAAKKKELPVDKKDKEADDDTKDEYGNPKKKMAAKASVEDVLDDTKENPEIIPPNGTTLEISMREEYADAFQLKDFKIAR